MADFILSCCSTADLSREHFEKRGISFICFHFELDGTPYMDDLGKSIPFDEFYQRMTDGADTKTSQINVEEYCEYFEHFLQEGKDILHLTLSSGISGSVNSARIAQGMLQEKYPERNIFIVDSLAASSGYGLLMDKLADLRDEGKSIVEVRDWAEENKKKLQHWFFSTDLTFFVKCGRISKGAALFCGVLNICPLMNVDYEGRLIPREKIRGKKAVIKRIVKKMEDLADDGVNYSGKVFMSHADCYEDAKEVADLIEATFARKNGKVEINWIGTTIGSHTGPGTVALFFFGKERID